MITRTLPKIALAIATIAILSQTCMADVTVIQGNSIRPKGASPVGDYGKIYKVSVTPAKETSPAFKYRFTIEPHKTIPGNSATHYLRSQGEGSLSGPDKAIMKQFGADAYQWGSSETKSEDISLDELRIASGMFDSFIKNHLVRATNCRETDWGLSVEDLRGRECVEFLLPSAQQTRTMARGLMLQNRLAVIEKRYDDSVDRLRMTYQLGQNVNEMGFLVTSLIGGAEVSMANDGALLLLSGEDAPNLYWALAELQTPIINLRKPMRLESSLPIRMFPELLDIQDADYSKEQWKNLLKRYIGEFLDLQQYTSGNFDARNVTHPTGAYSLALAFAGYSSAKKRLIERGHAADKVKAMCVSQVLLIDAAEDIQFFSQALEKGAYLPNDESDKFIRRWESNIGKQALGRMGAAVVATFSPAIQQVRRSALRVQAEVNLLMAIESLRNHAAIHGKFPESLAELDLPARRNPVTDKPFNYSLETGTAVLTLETGLRSTLRRYEISIAK